MQDDLGRIEEGDAGDERQKAVPEREGVAGMQAAVGELVDRLEREGVERLQLANAREVEEAVAADLAGDVPEQHAEHHSGSEHPPPPGNPLRPRRAPHERERHDPGAEQQDERQRERRAGGERDGQRAEEERERPGEGDRDAPQPESACDHRSRPQQDRRSRARGAPGSSLEQLRHAPRRKPRRRRRGTSAHARRGTAARAAAATSRAAAAHARRSERRGAWRETAGGRGRSHGTSARRATRRRRARTRRRGRRAPSSRPARSGSTSPSPR